MEKEKALLRLMRECSARELCCNDVLNKMERWDVLAADKKYICGELLRHGFIDEMRYAGAFVRDRHSLRGWGMKKIGFELKRRGIPDEIIREACSQLSQTALEEKLRLLLIRKNVSLRDADLPSRRAKLIRFACSRGYTYEQAYAVTLEITASV